MRRSDMSSLQHERVRLHRMPLVWLAVAVPAAFLFWMFFLMTPV